MENPKELPELTPEEILKAENEFLKMKLTAEFGMQDNESSLDEEAENEWLKYIYEYEKTFTNAKCVKVYDYIGRPEFKKINELKKEEVEKELARIFDILHKNEISLDCICEYDNEVMYKFITEELFELETDDVRIKGMTQHYIYEEFHPNHEYDLKSTAEEFFERFFKENWTGELVRYEFEDSIKYKNKSIFFFEFADILMQFRESNIPFRLIKNKIQKTEFSLESRKGFVTGELNFTAKSDSPEEINYSGKYVINFIFNDYYWGICELKFPGFE